ncbi:phosphotransferase family protein [Litoribrevibacter euphylliae]|uniref:Phosphotransferase family protein n=1 Tax=Litoribrevibacter euphylliae TaxID=1834034 RepID=A0ABV7HGY6_9GAMM
MTVSAAEQTAETLIDQATDIREGETLDLNALVPYLKSQLPELEGIPKVRQFPGGASNLTYLLQYSGKDLILRRPPFGTIAKSAHDMIREAQVIQSLKPVYPYVPEVQVICEDHSVIGCDFYVMERLVGIIPRQDLPKGLNLTEGDTRKLCMNVVDKLIELHSIDPVTSDLTSLGKGEGYVKRQISGWSDRYRKAITDNASGFEGVMKWLDEKQPKDIANRVIHNDYRFDNVVLNPDNPFEVIGVLDWEMATLGDPLMDLGNSLAYWIEADDDPQMQFMRRQPTHLKGMMTRKEVVDYYMDKTGFSVPCFDFYEIYGLFRLAVIIQQIYYRYHHGQTQDKRFANFIHAANYLEQRCMKLIEKSQL